MQDSNTEPKTSGLQESGSHQSGLGIRSRVAPAVALLLLGNSAAYAVDFDNEDDGPIAVPEPSTLALLAAGAVVAGAAKYVRNRNKQRKK